MNCQGVSLFPVFTHKFFHTKCICFYSWQDREKNEVYWERDKPFARKRLSHSEQHSRLPCFGKRIESYYGPGVLVLFDFIRIVQWNAWKEKGQWVCPYIDRSAKARDLNARKCNEGLGQLHGFRLLPLHRPF